MRKPCSGSGPSQAEKKLPACQAKGRHQERQRFGRTKKVKRFQYRLETVLAYKTQVLDNLKTEHAAILQDVNRKQDEIRGLHQELSGYESQFDEAKENGISIENYRLFDMCIGRMEEIIDVEKERLKVLRKKEDAKKQEVIGAKVDTSKFEKLKEKKYQEYQKIVAKADEMFVEEFVSNTSMQLKRQHRG